MNDLDVFRLWQNAQYAEETLPGFETPCLVWTGEIYEGYGRMIVGRVDGSEGVRIRVHRFAWEVCHGQIPEGKMVQQRCGNKACLNPAHLFLTDNVAVRGSNHYRAELTEEIVRYVRDICERSEDLRATKRWIIEYYGIDRSYLNKILRRVVWKHC